MKKYPKYKKTNIEWLEQIPEHWEVKKFKFINAEVETGKRENSEKEEVLSIGGEHIQQSKFYLKNKRYVSLDFYNNYNKGRLKIGDTLLVKDGATIGKAMFVNSLPSVNMMLNEHVFRINYNKLLYYIIISSEVQKYFWMSNQSSAQESITLDTLNSLPILLPPLSEQKAIADYLDKKTSEIDQIIEAKKKLIALYNEEKSALINKAVTKGIDDKAKLKPSGVEWLGDIPQHWEVKKLNRIADITLGKTLSSKKKGDMTEEYYLRSANIDWYKPRLDSIKKMWFTPHEKSKMKVEKYDLIVSEGGDVGRTCIWNDEIENCYIQNSVHRVRFENRIEALYYLNLFVLYGKLGVYDSVVNRISIAHLTVDKISSLVFPFPPLKEQEKIVEYIEKNVRVIDKKIANAKRLIELMTEYRTTLISEVVTGKVKVV